MPSAIGEALKSTKHTNSHLTILTVAYVSQSQRVVPVAASNSRENPVSQNANEMILRFTEAEGGMKNDERTQKIGHWVLRLSDRNKMLFDTWLAMLREKKAQ